MKPTARVSPYYSGGYDYSQHQRRGSSDWKGIGFADGFKQQLDYYARRLARSLFYQLLRKLQKRVARLTGAGRETDLQPKVKPQLSACYSSYPANLAALAALGHTACLEYEARVKSQLLVSHLAEYLKAPAVHDEVDADPAVYQQVAQKVARWVQTRLLLEDLARVNALQPVEIYRLFSAYQETLEFRTLDEILRAVLLYGDVLPPWSALNLHPLTRAIVEALSALGAPFGERLRTLRHQADFVALGEQWVRKTCRGLAPFLPPSAEAAADAIPLAEGSAEPGVRFGWQRQALPEDPEQCRFAPLSGPQPPALAEPQDAAQQIAQAMGLTAASGTAKEAAEQDGAAPLAALKETLSQFSQAVEAAGGQPSQHEDLRADLVDRAARDNPFQQGPIEGNPVDGHEVVLQLDGDQEARGEIHDRAVELSEDPFAAEQWRGEAQPITAAIQRLLYPNVQEVPRTERLRASGALDPARLVLASVSSAVYRRYRIHRQADRRGRSLLVIACDGSGSLNKDQMHMVKLLASAWLSAVVGSDVQVLAGLYHSGQIRPGVAGPLVQWMFHPQKTLAFSAQEALRAVAALPDSGTGVQSDALSLQYILEEAQGLAKGNMIYLIVITDTQWNRSFNTPRTGGEEVTLFFEKARTTLAERLHTTLVGLGVSGETGFEQQVDAVLTVSAQELRDATTVAGKVGVYVAGLMQRRQRLSRNP